MRKSVVVVVVSLTGLVGCGKSAPPPPVAASAPADVSAAPGPEVAKASEDVATGPADAAAAVDAAPAGDAAATGAAAAAIDGAAVGDVEPPLPPEPWALSPPVAVPAATPITGACVPELIESYSSFGYTAVNGRKLELCRWGDAPDHVECWSLDLDTSTLAPMKVPKAAKVASQGGPVMPKELKVTAGGRAAKSCVGKSCVALDLQGMTAWAGGVSAGRVFVAAGMADAEGADESKAVRVYDATSGAELSSHTFGELESVCPMFSWAGEVLYVEAGVCAGPGAVGIFYDAVSGKKLGVLGGASESASAYGVTPLVLPSGLVAFREQYGRGIFFHDGKTGAIVKRMNLVAALVHDASGEPSTSPEEGWMQAVPTADGKVELVLGNGAESRRRLLVVDPETQALTRVLELPRCP